MSRIITDIKYGFIESVINDKPNIILLFIFPTILFLLLGNVLGGLRSQLPNNTASSMSYFDFMLPGILAFFIMSAAQMAAGTIIHYRKSGVFRKLAKLKILHARKIAAFKKPTAF